MNGKSSHFRVGVPVQQWLFAGVLSFAIFVVPAMALLTRGLVQPSGIHQGPVTPLQRTAPIEKGVEVASGGCASGLASSVEGLFAGQCPQPPVAHQ